MKNFFFFFDYINCLFIFASESDWIQPALRSEHREGLYGPRRYLYEHAILEKRPQSFVLKQKDRLYGVGIQVYPRIDHIPQ